MFRNWLRDPLTVSSEPRRRRAPRANGRRQPLFDALEQRELLVATAGSLGLGVNVDAQTYYTPSPMFVDVMKETADSWTVASPSTVGLTNVSGVSEPPMDSNGYPEGLGNLPSQNLCLYTSVFTNNGATYPTGVYTLTFDGDGTVGIANGNENQQVFSQSGGTGSPHNVYINFDAGTGIEIEILASNPADYVDNIRLVMPGFQNTYTTQPFNPTYLAQLEPFQTLRMTGPMNLNTTTQQVGMTWSEETPFTYRTQTAATGVSVQYLVDLANTLQENLWVAMPVGANTSYVTNFSQYVEQNLDTNLNVYVEYGNEVWNTGYSNEWNYVNNYATSNGLTFEQSNAILATADWNIWRQSFAGQTQRVVRVVANQFANPSLMNDEISELVKISSPSDPDHGFEVVSGATYFAPSTSSFTASTTVQQIEQAYLSSLTSLQSQLNSFTAVVNQWSATLGRKIQEDMYEGTIDIAPETTSVPWYNAYIACQTDPGMNAVYTAYLDDLKAAGISEQTLDNLDTIPSQYGEWGLTNYAGQPASQTPMYDAALNFLASESASLSISSPPASVTAGVPISLTVTAHTASGAVNTGYIGTITFTSTDPHAVLPAPYTFKPGDAGVHTFSITFDSSTAQAIDVTDATDGMVALDWGISVAPAAAKSLAVVGYASPSIAGVGNWFNVFALDGYGNIATNYTGTVALSSSAAEYSNWPAYTFQPSDQGGHTFLGSINSAGTQTLIATDTAKSSITGSETGILVSPGAPVKLAITGFPSSVVAGVTKTFTVSALDAFGNVTTNYLDTVLLLSTDTSATMPAPYTFTTADAGKHTFSVTLFGAGSISLIALDMTNGTFLTEQTGIQVVAAAPTSVTVTGFASPNVAGSKNGMTVTLYDPYGNVATGYTGTIKFSSSDPQANLPANYTFRAGNGGKYIFYAVLETAGAQSITVTDTGNGSLTGKQTGIIVQPSTAETFAVTGFPSPVIAGVPGTFKVTAFDSYGNVATGYTGTVAFTSSDSKAILPANDTFTSANGGVATFQATLKTAGTQSITAGDTSSWWPRGTQSGIVVQAGTTQVIGLSGLPSTVEAGQSYSVSVTAYDDSGAVAANYLGVVGFSSGDPAAYLPSSYAFAPADMGAHRFTVKFKTKGTTSLTVFDRSTGQSQTISGIQVV
jgi:hypothetical protein